MSSFAKAYKAAALYTFNTLVTLLVVFFLLHIASVGIFAVWDRYFKNANPVSRKYGDALLKAYPGWSPADMDQLLAENWGRPMVYEPYTQFKEGPINGKFVQV